jgi:predicted component of type VI protein secretion system
MIQQGNKVYHEISLLSHEVPNTVKWDVPSYPCLLEIRSELLKLKEASMSSRDAAEKELKEMQILISEVKAKATSTAAFVSTAASEGPKKG